MRQQIATQTGVGSSNIIVTDTYICPFNVGFGVVVTGAATYTVQHTFDDPQVAGATLTWFGHPTVAAKTDSQDGNYAFPVAAIKLVVTVGTGTAVMTLIQAGVVGG
tara:strand:+ start:364 stop:681 length:318 start_codon:yes stop_codon:yes gene_type:complete